MTGAEEKYLEYLKGHIAAVGEAYGILVRNGITPEDEAVARQLKEHDKSKFEEEEFWAYAEKFFGNGDEAAFRLAWERHQRINPHHWQYWVKDGRSAHMPENYIIEMICDWFSFSVAENNFSEVQDFYNKRGEKMNLSDKTRQRVETLLKKMEVFLQKTEPQREL